jgi:S-methylmethionine-dependent homocysteine/selenocysteine methylase
VRKRLENLMKCGEHWEAWMHVALKMANEARQESGEDVLIAGCLPPLHGSYRPDIVGAMEDITPVYAEHVALMAPHVDFFLCETMSNAAEGWAAASEAKKSGKPVWVSWTIKDDASALLRSGETLEQAYAAIVDLKPDAVLVNCTSPESITAALPHLAKMGAPLHGGYGNGFGNIPDGWRVENGGIAALGKRELTPPMYAMLCEQWLKSGSNIVGGCCEVGPDHITAISQIMKEQSSGTKRKAESQAEILSRTALAQGA